MIEHSLEGASTDIELMLRARDNDDVAAFGVLTRRWRAALRRYFAATLADRSRADDHAQETFLRLWLQRKRYQPTGRFEAYLLTIARHYGLNQQVKFRRRPREVAAGGGDEHGGLFTVEAPAHTSQPERILLERYERARIRAAIDALPPRCRAVFTLSHDDGLRYREIACRLGVPVGTVKSRMADAVRRLRAALAAAEIDQGNER